MKSRPGCLPTKVTVTLSERSIRAGSNIRVSPKAPGLMIRTFKGLYQAGDATTKTTQSSSPLFRSA